MKHLVWVALAVLLNAGAQIALKMGASQPIDRLETWFSLPIIAGLVLYAVSFVLTIKIYAYYPLSVISPAMAGAIFVVITLASYLFFAESVNLTKLAGIGFVVAGISLLSRAG